MNRGKRLIPVIFFILTLSLLMDTYVYQGIKMVTENISNQNVQFLIRGIYWFVFLGLPIALGIRIYSVGMAPGKSGLTERLFSVFITLFITNLVFIIVLFAEDMLRFFLWIRNAVVSRPDAFTGALMPERNLLFSEAGSLLAGFAFISFLYGITKGKYRYKVHKHILYFDDLPAAFDGFKIAQISDIHSGSFNNSKEVQKGIDLVNAQKADLFLFTGDLVNNLATEIEPYLDQFKQIKSPYGQFSVLGNHDYGDYVQWPDKNKKDQNLNNLKQHHHYMDFRLLLNEHIIIEKDDAKMILLGVENWGKGFGEKGDLNKALLNVDPDAFKILLSHDPSHWDEVIKKHDSVIHLTLSGHTHGMQVGIELPFFKWSPVKMRYNNWSGLATENGRNLYVNRGFGFIGFLGRVGIWPEITLIELRKK